ncbi:MAG TPA: alpha/beta fold hydrolase, partial [Planctomycetota bacterium]|nr:alpha/beta fold hydrolase [Planctomycetota bacterium]
DRVFGMSDRLPPQPIVTRESREYDLLSVSVDGAEVAYAQQGRVALPPLVLLHGWAASHKFWKYCFSAFSPRWRVIAPDMVGFGISEKPRRDYRLEALSDWLGKFLDALKLDRVALVGHSMGATISLIYAMAHPERIRKLAVVNPLVVGATAFNSRTKMCLLPGVRALLFWGSRLTPIRRWVTKDFSYVAQVDEDLSRDLVRGSYQSTFDSLISASKTDLRPTLSSLAVETLAIGTDRDQLVAPDQYALVPAHQRELIADTGHIPMIERPGEFNRILNGFLSQDHLGP